MNRNDTQKAIESGKTVLGIEFGSTRIKAVLIGEDHAPIASGGHEWENRYENGIWTYSLEDVWKGLQESYRNLCNEVLEKYNTPLQTIGALGFSGMMHGYLAFDKDGNLLAPFGTWRNTITGQAAEKLYRLPGRQRQTRHSRLLELGRRHSLARPIALPSLPRPVPARQPLLVHPLPMRPLLQQVLLADFVGQAIATAGALAATATVTVSFASDTIFDATLSATGSRRRLASSARSMLRRSQPRLLLAVRVVSADRPGANTTGTRPRSAARKRRR